MDEPSFTEAPAFDLNEALKGGPSGGSNQSQRGVTRDDVIRSIENLIQNTIGKRQQWKVYGGDHAIRELNSNLIIKTTPSNHGAIENLLHALRTGPPAE